MNIPKIFLMVAILIIGSGAIANKNLDNFINGISITPIPFHILKNLTTEEKASRVRKYNKYYNHDRLHPWVSSVLLPLAYFAAKAAYIHGDQRIITFVQSGIQEGRNYKPDVLESAIDAFGKPAFFMVADEAISRLSQTETVQKAVQVVPQPYRNFVVEEGKIVLAGAGTEVLYTVANGLSKGTAWQDLQNQPRCLVKKAIVHGSIEGARKATDFAIDKGLAAVGYAGEGWTKSGLKVVIGAIVARKISSAVNNHL